MAAISSVTAMLMMVGGADAALEPVTITPSVPTTVTAGVPFKLEVIVEAEAGAFDIAAQPLLLGLKLAPECGGSFVGTPSPPVLERTLPTVPAGSAFSQLYVAEVSTAATGTETVCAFLQDGQERQFATNTEAEVTVSSAPSATAAGQKQCTESSGTLTATRRSLKRLNRRIAKTRRHLHRTHGAPRKALRLKLHKLRAKRHRLAKRRTRIARTAGGPCS